ncbi:MAG TPA: DUF2891 family protein, partial [Thermoanaerobaculia bacterium]
MVKRALALAAVLLGAATLNAQIDPAMADRFAKLALACVDREYPNKPEQVLEGPSDVRAPREFHPAFYGCYDWHSSVHGHWMLARLLRAAPGLASDARIREVLDGHFTREAIAAETHALEAPGARTFERPYGWAWTLRLAAELEAAQDPQERAWRGHIQP